MNPNELKTYTFIDGDFSMDINVSIEEHNVYMNQIEIAKLLGIGQSTVSKKLRKWIFLNGTYIPKMNKLEYSSMVKK